MINKVKVCRAEMDMTQEELAKKVGISRQTVHAIEKGKYVPSTVLSLKIANLFERKVEDIFILEEDD